MGDEQAIMVFLRQLDHALSDALRGCSSSPWTSS
jgi:hypothetical protein